MRFLFIILLFPFIIVTANYFWSDQPYNDIFKKDQETMRDILEILNGTLSRYKTIYPDLF